MLHDLIIPLIPLLLSAALVVVGIVIMTTAYKGGPSQRRGSLAKAMTWTVATFATIVVLDNWIGRYSITGLFPTHEKKPAMQVVYRDLADEPLVAQDP